MSDARSDELGWGSAESATIPVPGPTAPSVESHPELPPTPEEKSKKKSSGIRSLVEWVAIIVVALLGALLIRTVLFQAFFIPSASMTPTLKVHDRILVNKLSYDLHPIHRGDIIVFKRPPNMVEGEQVKDLVKRVIGLPGETIDTSADGHIEINGRPLKESYLPAGIPPGPQVTRQVIAPGHYFVMGDNRDDSSDSRVFGPISKGTIIGRAFILIWPLPDFSLL